MTPTEISDLVTAIVAILGALGGWLKIKSAQAHAKAAVNVAITAKQFAQAHAENTDAHAIPPTG